MYEENIYKCCAECLYLNEHEDLSLGEENPMINNIKTASISYYCSKKELDSRFQKFPFSKDCPEFLHEYTQVGD